MHYGLIQWWERHGKLQGLSEEWIDDIVELPLPGDMHVICERQKTNGFIRIVYVLPTKVAAYASLSLMTFPHFHWRIAVPYPEVVIESTLERHPAKFLNMLLEEVGQC